LGTAKGPTLYRSIVFALYWFGFLIVYRTGLPSVYTYVKKFSYAVVIFYGWFTTYQQTLPQSGIVSVPLYPDTVLVIPPTLFIMLFRSTDTGSPAVALAYQLKKGFGGEASSSSKRKLIAPM